MERIPDLMILMGSALQFSKDMITNLGGIILMLIGWGLGVNEFAIVLGIEWNVFSVIGALVVMVLLTSINFVIATILAGALKR